MIAVECPHCETTFQLQASVLGKMIRCPNPDCQELFLATAATMPPADSPTVTTDQEDRSIRASSSFSLEPNTTPDELPYERVEADRVEPVQWEPESSPGPFAAESESLLSPQPESLLPSAEDTTRPRPAQPIPVAHELPAMPITARPSSGEASASSLPIPVAKTVAASSPAKSPTGMMTSLPPFPAKKPADSGPREVVWTGEAPPPPAPLAEIQAENFASSEPPWKDEPFVRRRRKNPWGRRIAVGLGLSLVAVLLGLGVMFSIYQARTEERLAAEAQAAYEARNFGLAAKQFQMLVEGYPQSSRSLEYQFFAGLAATRAAAEAPSARQSPQPALEQFRAFLNEFGTSPFAQPGGGYGSDLVEAGQKLGSALAEHAADELKAAETAARQLAATWPEYLAYHQQDQRAMQAIAAAKDTLEAGEQLVAGLDRFREKDGLNFEEQQKRFAELHEKIVSESARAAAIKPWRDLPGDPTDLRIEQFEKAMRAGGFLDDPEVRRLTEWAREELRKRITGSLTFRSAEQKPESDQLTGFFSVPVAEIPPIDRMRGSDAVPVFAVVRGIVYALDAMTGDRLWAVRVADVAAHPRSVDVPIVMTLADGQTSWALVVSERQGQAGLTARDARTGKAIWHQPLEAGVAGRPLILHRRIYVPLADPLGTVVEIQLATGARIGQFQIRQKIAAELAGGAGPIAGTSRLYVPADARHVFVLEVGSEAADGTALPPRLVRDLATDHPRDSLTGTTLLIGQTPENEPRYLLLTVANGPAAMAVRCYDLTQGDPPPVAEVILPGWSRFPAATNGEQVVVATDAGEYAVLGVNQEGNNDRPIFMIAGVNGPEQPQREVDPALVVDAGAERIWLIVRQKLIQVLPAVDPMRGLRFVQSGKPIPVGEPIHRAQQYLPENLNIVVTRTVDGHAFRATAFDRHTGAIRWQQQLGVIPEQWWTTDTGLVLAGDSTGACYEAISGVPLLRPVADAVRGATIIPDQDRLWSLVPTSGQGKEQLHVREFVLGAARPDLQPGSSALAGAGGAMTGCGSSLAERALLLPAPLAGVPVAVAKQPLVPVGDGHLYRLSTNGTNWERGPRWSDTLPEPDRRCVMTPLSSSRILITDGRRQVQLWEWPSGSPAPKSPVLVWETRHPIVQAPLILGEEPLRFLTVDDSGTVSLFCQETPGEPQSRWLGRLGEPGPAGKIRQPIQRFVSANQERILVVQDQRVLVCLDARNLTTIWTAPEIPLPAGLEWVGVTIHGTKIYAVDQTGRVAIFRSDDGRMEGMISAPPTGALAIKGLAIPRPGVAYLPLLDGSRQELRIPSAD